MDRRSFLSKSGISLATLGVGLMTADRNHALASGTSKDRPNIFMITAHDLGRHLGCYGIDTVNTPNIDRLAAKGIRFANYFAVDCVCSPSRGGFMTGRYPQSNGLMGLTHQPWGWSLNRNERHLAAILKDAGYHTILAGLQHVTSGNPLELGYDKHISPRRKAEETVDAVGKVFAKARKGGKPLFIKAGFFEVHRPFTNGKDTEKGVYVPPYLADTPEVREDLAQYQGTIRFFDKCVGRMLDSLYESEIADNTLVVFTADHGIPYPRAKWCLYDAGIETPLIMYQPGTAMTGGKVYESLMSNVDLLPTLLDTVGINIPHNVQGISFRKLIAGRTSKPPRTEVYAQRTSHALRDNTSRTIRTDRYKLIRYFDPGRVVLYPVKAVPQDVAAHVERPSRKGTRPVVQLFDIQQDPQERNNLSSKPRYAQIERELSDKLWRWMEEVGDPILQGPLRTPYYEKAISDYERFKQQKSR